MVAADLQDMNSILELAVAHMVMLMFGFSWDNVIQFKTFPFGTASAAQLESIIASIMSKP